MNLLPGWFPGGVMGGASEVVALWTATRFNISTGNTHTFTDVPIGEAHPSRRIFALLLTFNANLNPVGAATSMTIGGESAPELYITPGATVDKRSIRAVDIPSGETATIVANRSTESGFSNFGMGVFAVYNLKDGDLLDEIDINADGSSAGTLDVLLGGAILAFATASTGAPDIAWTGATVANNVDSNQQLSAAVNNPTGGGTQEVTATSTFVVSMIACSLR